MTHEHAIDLVWKHFVAGDDDHLFLPPDDAMVSVLIDYREIAGVEPAVAQRIGGFRRHVPVPAHDLWATDRQLSRLAAGRLGNSVVHAHRLGVGVTGTPRGEPGELAI